jgi:hypothetical protein
LLALGFGLPRISENLRLRTAFSAAFPALS